MRARREGGAPWFIARVGKNLHGHPHAVLVVPVQGWLEGEVLALKVAVKTRTDKGKPIQCPRTHVSGVTRWLNEHRSLIQLFYGAAHILLHSKQKDIVFG